MIVIKIKLLKFRPREFVVLKNKLLGILTKKISNKPGFGREDQYVSSGNAIILNVFIFIKLCRITPYEWFM